MSKREKMSFLFISLPWLSNKFLWNINKLKHGLWCTIWLSYIHIYIYMYWIEPLPNLSEFILGIQSFWGPFDLKPYNDSYTEIVLKNQELQDHSMLWAFLYFAFIYFYIYIFQILNILLLNSKVPSLDNFLKLEIWSL